MRTLWLASFVFPLLLAAQPAPGDWKSEGIIYVNHSPHVKLHSVPVRAVRMGDGFWASRRDTNLEKSIPSMLKELEQHGIVDNFLRLEGKKAVGRRGPLYTDSDIYKWMESVAFVLQSGDEPRLREQFDRLTDIISAAQEPSGYLNTYWSGENAPRRFTEMQSSHELYCMGHLLQAAIAYYRATGNRKLLDTGIRFANYMVENFGPQKRPALTGHPEFEMAMVELYRTTGDRRYLDFAGYLLSGVERERLHLKDYEIQYMFSGKPFTSRTEFEGHAVRAMYASCGATDYYAETGDPAYLKTLDTLWQDLVTRKMYITGGVGSREAGEAFGEAYELPNAQAYGESCAAIGNMMWNWRMLLVKGESRYADVIERALYNGINSGMSLNGTLYCYRNPLESSGEKIRNEWYDTTCCPPNLERILASLPGYMYTTSPEGVQANLFHNSELDWHLENGTGIKIRQQTEYPWKGAIDFFVDPASPSEFSLYLRIPDWAIGTTVTANKWPQRDRPVPGEYYEIHRKWEAGDKVHLEFAVTPRLVRANPLVRENAGRVAVERGPLVYCLEQPDQPGFNLFDASLLLDGSLFLGERRPGLLGGIIELKHRGAVVEQPLSSEPLYQSFRNNKERPGKQVDLTFIPYYAWANRGESRMEVWVPYTTVDSPAAAGSDALPQNAFNLLPLTSVKPRGWLRRQLEIQAAGLSGHLDEIWPDVGPNSGWLGGTGESWERGPYYLDGLVPLAYELADPTLIRKAKQWVDWTLDHQRPDGSIGPEKNKDWWPNMLMLKALTQYEEATGDPRVIPALSRYFAYQAKNLDARPLYEWARFRWADELLAIVWLYRRTHDDSLLDLGRKIGSQGYDWKAQFADFQFKTKVPKAKADLRTHGVNNAMALKTSAVWSLISGDPSDRHAIYQMLRELDEYHLLPSEVHSADEHYAGKDPSQGTELCAVVEAQFSLENLVAILGDPAFADRLENITFNALPATFTKDMWAHQYDQQPNQIQCDVNPRAWETNGPDSNLFGLEPNFGCCTANMHQGWPKFAANLWMSTPDGGVAAVAYAPSEVKTKVAGGEVAIVEETEYPFRDSIRLTVNPSAPARFPLVLRIPAWATTATVRVNGTPAEKPGPGSFYRINREWHKGDIVDLTFPMHMRVKSWAHDSISLERGPLIYSLRIGENWKKLRQKGTAADWEVDPTTPWNYGLVIDPNHPDRSVTIEEKPLGQYPFSPEGAPVILRVKGRQVPEWKVVKGSAGPLPRSPVRSTQPVQTLELIPYGAAKLRITAFPRLN
ncbi:MAG: glycoside hydrolase family 127 protein [Bryobacteraceae bacterium]